MPLRFALVWLTLLIVPPAASGSTGSLVFQVRDSSGKPVPDAAVWATPAAPPEALPEPEEATIDQINKEFVPHVTVVRVGTPVLFPNQDDIRHHVYSFSAPKRFELPLYKGEPAEPVVFDTPGTVALGCNIHDSMVAHVVVVETPFFAVTDAEGAARISGLPAGECEVDVWHPRLRADPKNAGRSPTVEEESEVLLEYEVDLRPDWGAPRVGRRGGGYR